MYRNVKSVPLRHGLARQAEPLKRGRSRLLLLLDTLSS